MIIIITIIAFLLEHLFSTFVSTSSLFLPLFVLITLILVYPFYYNNKLGYLKYALIVGILYDIIFTNTLFFNMLLFFLMALIIQKVSFVIIINFLNINFITALTIVIYLIISYFLLVVIDYKDFNFNYLLKITYSSLIINVIYNFLAFLIIEKLSQKYKITRIN